MNEGEIRKGIEILQNAVKDNRVHSKHFVVGESELIATLNALHKAIDIEKELQQEKEKNKKAYIKANNYLYFDDSSDYGVALWEVIRSLRPDLAERWDNGETADLKYIEE